MTNSSSPQRAEQSITDSRPAASINPRILLAVAILAILVVTVFGVRSYHLNTYTIPSSSMEPGLHIADRIEINPDAYQHTEPQRGQVVVFDGSGSLYPYESETQLKRFTDAALSALGMAPKDHAVVKRIIGVGGDTVKCCTPDGQLLVNDKPLAEPYLAEPHLPASSSPFEVEIPDGRVFVLGDNRYDSIDSRSLLGAPGGGMIQINKIYGPVTTTR